MHTPPPEAPRGLWRVASTQRFKEIFNAERFMEDFKHQEAKRVAVFPHGGGAAP